YPYPHEPEPAVRERRAHGRCGRLLDGASRPADGLLRRAHRRCGHLHDPQPGDIRRAGGLRLPDPGRTHAWRPDTHPLRDAQPSGQPGAPPARLVPRVSETGSNVRLARPGRRWHPDALSLPPRDRRLRLPSRLAARTAQPAAPLRFHLTLSAFLPKIEDKSDPYPVPPPVVGRRVSGGLSKAGGCDGVAGTWKRE